MSRRYNRFDQYRDKFIRVPKVFMTNEIYKKLSNDAKIAYAILQDRQELSIKNGWYDKEGNIYFVYSNPNLVEILGLSINTVTKVVKELKKAKLLEDKPTGRAKRYYLLKPEVTEDDIYMIDKTENATGESPEDIEKEDEPQNLGAEEVHKNCEAGITKSVKQVHKICEADSQNLTPNDTELRETDSTETEFNENLNPNPNPVDIYDILWNLEIPNALKIRIKVKIASNEISLNANQLLQIEDAYKYQIQRGYIISDCAFDYTEALNDDEFTKTIIKMLNTVRGDIPNMRGLIKSWVENALSYKKDQFHATDYSNHTTNENLPFYDWINS